MHTKSLYKIYKGVAEKHKSSAEIFADKVLAIFVNGIGKLREKKSYTRSVNVD